MSWIEKLKERWGVATVGQVIVILLVFACTGFSVLYAKKPFYWLLNIDSESAWWIKTLATLFIVLPLYQVLLLFYGFIFGQFTFFWTFEKRSFGRIFSLFSSEEKVSKEE